MDEKRLALIRYVSSHYGDLQGLTDMAVAAVVGSMAVWTLVFGFHWGLPIVGLGLLAGTCTVTNRYYRERFGRVRRPTPETPARNWGWLFGLLGGLAAAWDGKHVGSGLPSFFVLVFTAFALWRVIFDWPLRAHRLLVVGAGLLASMLYVAVDSDARHREWVATSFCLWSIALFVAGWLDHRLLVRAMSSGAAGDAGEATNERVV